jgi:hypothetical protein
MAAGGYETYAFDGSNWSSGMHLPGARDDQRDVSCVSPTFCMAVGYDGTASRWDGTTWHRAKVADREQFSALKVSCASPSFCAATVDGGVAFWDGTRWGARHGYTDDSTSDAAVSCPSIIACVISNRGGAIVTVNPFGASEGVTVSLPEDSNGLGMQDVACPRADECFAAMNDSIVYIRPLPPPTPWS